MGFWANWKEIFSVMKQYKQEMRKESKMKKMSVAELSALDDSDLLRAATIRTERKVDSARQLAEGINRLSERQKVFYCVNYFWEEVQNGGLCQFFVNSSRILAPSVSSYLDLLGAGEYKALYDGFTQKYAIPLSDLSSFIVSDETDYRAQTERFPFEEFDDAFSELTPLSEYLVRYLKADLAEFFKGI